MNVRVIAVGRLKERFYEDAQKEFVKRLSRYCAIEVIEVQDEPAREKLSSAERERVLDIEGARILSRVREDETLVALCIDGEMRSSEQFASEIAALALAGKSKISFAIGGSLGLSEGVRRRANIRLSFSPMTFSHQIFRAMLLEQIYRAFKINAGEPYHK
ncbi:MAG: 23S rRNA (pseudouridine(1915)-N(3))-methyltransferase RlmH [Bacillota bacterium]